VSVDVYLEAGAKRTFAGAMDWPGWCRRGRDADEALEALVAYGPRYRSAIARARLGFRPPADVAALRVVERLPGDATTDFGVPGAAPSRDRDPVEDADLQRARRALRACWSTFDAVAERAQGRRLKAGPRGGGRALRKIVDHVVDADEAYLRSLGVPFRVDPADGPAIEQVRGAIVAGLWEVPRDEPDRRGPRGGRRWTPRYAVRRIAWHVLDHAWEIEDRLG
jgi:hypothetical protein